MHVFEPFFILVISWFTAVMPADYPSFVVNLVGWIFINT